VYANFSRPGQTPRTTGSYCAHVSDLDSYTANYSCSILMWYFDAPGDWNVSIRGKDLHDEQAFNISTYFQYNQLKAIVISPSQINFGTLEIGKKNQTAINDPTYINNTGNANASITVSGINLYGEDFTSEFIDVGNVSVNVSTGGSPPVECGGTRLQNGTDIQILGAVLIRGNLSQGGGTGQEELYYCLKQVPSNIPSQTYSTKERGSWLIKIVASVAIVLVPRLRKRRKKKRAKLVQKLNLVVGELSQKYSLKEIIKKLRVKYKRSGQELLKLIRLRQEPKIPITIFSRKLGALESVAKYMKENLGMQYYTIAQLLNRDDRTIWTAYKKATAKQKEPIKVERTEIFLPLERLKDRRLTILGSVIMHLKSKGFAYNEIAKILNRDQRNIWTIYSRAVRKIKGKV